MSRSQRRESTPASRVYGDERRRNGQHRHRSHYGVATPWESGYYRVLKCPGDRCERCCREPPDPVLESRECIAEVCCLFADTPHNRPYRDAVCLGPSVQVRNADLGWIRITVAEGPRQKLTRKCRRYDKRDVSQRRTKRTRRALLKAHRRPQRGALPASLLGQDGDTPQIHQGRIRHPVLRRGSPRLPGHLPLQDQSRDALGSQGQHRSADQHH